MDKIPVKKHVLIQNLIEVPYSQQVKISNVIENQIKFIAVHKKPHTPRARISKKKIQVLRSVKFT